MKIASYRLSNHRSYGVVLEDGILDLGRHFDHSYADLKAALAADVLAELEDLVSTGTADVAFSEVSFLPVIPEPGKILCVGINYMAHIREMGRDVPAHPWLFVRFADSQVGHEESLIRPSVSNNFDFEGELAVIIGSPAHRVSAADALDYVGGYSCFNDASVRDFQRHSSQFTAGKNFYRSGSFGPWMVTPDEIGDPRELFLQTRLNGEVMQKAPVDDLVFDVPSLIEYCSTFARLEPGDVIVTGTPGGVGAARTPPVWMKPGDIIEVEISRIGTLRNDIAQE